VTAPLAAATAPPVAGAEEERPGLAPVLALAFVLAACSILYELLAAQTLSLLAANTVVWYSLVVGVFLASMGWGAFRSRGVAEGTEWRALFRVEIALTAAGALAVPLLRAAHAAFTHLEMAGRSGPALFVFYALALAVVVAIGVLTGVEMPLLMRVARGPGEGSRPANLVLGVDYLGSLAGALAFPLVVLPSMGLLAAGLAVAAVNLVVAAWILGMRVEPDARRSDRFLVGACTVALLAGIVHVDRVEQYLLRRFYYRQELAAGGWWERFRPRPDLPRVGHARSPYQDIDLVRDVRPDFMAALMPAYSGKLAAEPDFPVDHTLFLNGDFQTNTRYEEIYHEWFAHVPVVAHGRVPEEVLLLGGGDGLLLRELLKHPGIRRIRHVDLDPVLVGLAKNDPVLRKANHDSLRDPRVETVIGDGYQWVRRSRERFEAIYIDFPAAVTYDLAKLYSREFFEFVRRRIAPGGYAVFDGTGTSILTERNEDGVRWLTPENDWPIYYHTLRKAGFRTVRPYLTTLEPDNERAAAIAETFRLDPTVEARLARVPEGEQRDRARATLRESLVERLLRIHSIGLEQGFVLISPERREFRTEWKDPGVPLYALDGPRYGLAFLQEYPMPEAIEEARVNSILRPTMPTTPWWRPREGY
jgi:spermidine synthase